MLDTNWKGFRTIAWIAQGILAIGAVYVLVRGQWLPAAALAGFLLASFAFVKLERRLPTLFDMLFVFAALLNAGGWAWDLFNKPGLYDEVTHFYTLFAITLALGYLLFNRMFNSFFDHRVLFVLVIASLGVALGAWWEVVEWISDFFTPKQIVSGIDDTITDIMLDSGGALLAAVFNVYVLSRHSRVKEQEKGKPTTDDRRPGSTKRKVQSAKRDERLAK